MTHTFNESPAGMPQETAHKTPQTAVIDLHAHIACPSVEKLVAGHPARLAEIQATARLQGAASTEYNRTVMLPACMRKMTDIDTRIADMDAMDVDMQLLSPSPGQYYYWAEPDLSETIVREQNEHIAATCEQHRDRFLGLSAVSLQYPKQAAGQLEHAVKVLGLKGAEISTSAGERELADPSLDVFWQKADELGAVIFIHPLGTSLGARLDKHYLANVIGQPIETTIALSHLIFNGTLDRLPGLKILAAHGGGYLPTYCSRGDHAWHARPDAHAMAHPPSHYLRQIWFDNLVYTPEAMRALIDSVGLSQVVVGTDYPFDMGSYDVRALVAAIPDLAPADRAALLHDNAQRLLGL